MAKFTSAFEAKVVHRGLKGLHENPKIAKSCKNGVILELVAKLDEVGLIYPILIDLKCNVLVGTAMLKAARVLKLLVLPTVQIELLTKEELLAYACTNLQCSLQLDLDWEILNVELRDLLTQGPSSKCKSSQDGRVKEDKKGDRK